MSLSQVLTVSTDKTSYPIVIGQSELARLAEHLAQVLVGSRRLLFVTDETVELLYRPLVEAALADSSFSLSWQVFPAGEASKTLANWQHILSSALEAGLSRRDAIVALGGGVIGDMAGFAAASYYRGCPFIQIPTTLLSQVDSSVGGKVAVNLGEVKNSIGAFYQPKLVVADMATLDTLPGDEYRAGMAEVVKYAFLERTALNDDSAPLALFELLERPDTSMRQIVAHCCQLKAAVVARDEQEQGATHDATGRVCLNLGHTFAHAFEAAGGYHTYLHGQAVAFGLQLAIKLSQQLGYLSERSVKRSWRLLEQLDLLEPIPSQFEADSLVRLMLKDKKNQQEGQLRLILPVEPLGCVRVITDLTSDFLQAFLYDNGCSPS